MKHDALLHRLRAAFPPVPIDAALAFDERGRFYCDAGDYRRQLHGKTWEQLDPEFFARRNDALSFLNTTHVVAVLPLYLHLLLVSEPSSTLSYTLLSMLTKPELREVRRAPPLVTIAEYFDLNRRFFEDLTRALIEDQSRVVAATLHAFIAAAPNEGTRALPALERYWHAFVLDTDLDPLARTS